MPRPTYLARFRGRLSRRALLRFSSTAALALAVGCSSPSPAPDRTPPRPPRGGGPAELRPPTLRRDGFSVWARHARLANAGFGEDPTREELEDIVETLKSQKVNVIEVDTTLSDWQTDSQFEYTMLVASQFNRMVHRHGLKVVWYYPSLEVISPGGQHGPSLYKLHPDWVQLSLHGEPNVFHGGVVFWVEPGDESMWLSPNGPWREVYLDRIRMLARSGADGVWPDVPIYFHGAYEYCDTSAWARVAFKRDTGLETPETDDNDDPVWRRWIEWRHRNLNQFVIDIAEAGRSVNPDFETFVETVTCDYVDALHVGLDGAYLRLAEGVTHCWEVDVVSDHTAMHHATPDDWICLIAMYKYARAASGTKPAWAFDYGWREDDAAQVMAEVLATGCNPYEVKSPEKTAGVSAAMRRRMYSWVEANEARLFDARSLANVAVYHSSACRDYINPETGNGMYASTTKPEGVEKWWSYVEFYSVYTREWLGEYRGFQKALLHAHIPYNVLTSPTFHAEDLEGYKVFLMLDPQAISDQEAIIIRNWVHAGGTLLITGPSPTGLNELGDPRQEYALVDLLGFTKGMRPPASQHNLVGAGQVFYFSDFPGWSYLKSSEPEDERRIVSTVLAGAAPFVTTDAHERVRLEASELDGDIILQFVNRVGGTGDFKIIPTSFTIWLDVPADRHVSAVHVTSPDNPTPGLEPLPFAEAAGKVSISLEVKQYSMVVISWQ